MLREEYRAALAFLRGRRRMLRLVTVCFLAGGLATAIGAWTAFSSDPALIGTLMEQVGELLDSKQIADERGQLDAFRLFLANFWASGITLLYGGVPFLYLPLWPMALNAGMLGVVSAAALRMGIPPAALAASLLPHGVFEIPALLISGTMGLTFCHSIVRRILHLPEPLPLIVLIHELLRTTVLVVLPLLALAAVIEAQVTGPIASLFL